MARSHKPNVRRLARANDLDGLWKALHYRDTTVEHGVSLDAGAPIRLASVEALAASEDPRAQRAIADALSDSDLGVRRRAVEAIKWNGEPWTLNGIAWAASARSPAALARVRTPRGHPP